jgi:hypothetical protein
MAERSNHAADTILLVGHHGVEIAPFVPIDLLPGPNLVPSHSSVCPFPDGHVGRVEDRLGREPAVLTAPDQPRAGGVPFDLVEASDDGPKLHVAQSWKPLPCHCGEIHPTCEPSILTVGVGRSRVPVHHAPEALTIELVPAPLPRRTGLVRICPGGKAGFNPWARDIVRALTQPLLATGIIGWDFSDVARIMGERPAWRAVVVRADTKSFAQRLCESVPVSQSTGGMWVALEGPPSLRLSTINDAMTALRDRIADEADVLCCANINAEMPDEALRAAVLYTSEG